MHKASRLTLSFIICSLAIFLFSKALIEIVPVIPDALSSTIKAFNNTRTWFLEDKITTHQKSEYAFFLCLGGAPILLIGIIVLHIPDTQSDKDPLPSTDHQ